MSIATYTPSHAEAIVTLYNDTAAALPYCSPMDTAWFTEVIAAKHTFSPEQLWVYEEGRQAVGYVQCSFLSRSREDVALDRRIAGVDALFFRPDRMDVAAALLETALGYLRGQGTQEVGWWFNTWYPLYRGVWCGLEPAGCVSGAYHQRLALERAGFYLEQLSHMWYVGMAAAPEPARARAPVEVRAGPREFATVAERDSWRGIEARAATAWLEGRLVGTCLYSELPGYRAHRGYAAGSIGALSVSGDVQQTGIATQLVGAAMRDLYELGAREVWVATQSFNVAAHGTYRRLGFRRFAELYVMGREV
jgi:RimJ/RimL family protein N-acetyltransferase